MSDNPLDDSNPAREQAIRERAYHLWEADGRPIGREEEFWERARALIGIEESAHAGELPADRLPLADEAALQENLGEFPGRLSDRGERAQTPAKENRRA